MPEPTKRAAGEVKESLTKYRDPFSKESSASEGETIAGHKTAEPDIACIMKAERIIRRQFPVRKVPTPTFDLVSAVGADHPSLGYRLQPGSTTAMNKNPDKKDLLASFGSI